MNDVSPESFLLSMLFVTGLSFFCAWHLLADRYHRRLDKALQLLHEEQLKNMREHHANIRRVIHKQEALDAVLLSPYCRNVERRALLNTYTQILDDGEPDDDQGSSSL